MKDFKEDPLERLLDEESDLEFGSPDYKQHQTSLSSWTAQDFSDIYVRFYPHLLRHAKRYLTNHSQAEEVVQDAFLYLMTSLPEVDSEVGVLKLLKWKVRNLALDVISVNSRASFAPADDVEIAVDGKLSENLERADDAAIVSLALAKLNPRQRQALVASLYLEKETSEIAEELQLSENATRQLLFRAKSAFKKALVGEAETAGLSLSQILSLATKKAAKESGKYISAASALLLAVVVTLGFLPNLPARQAADNVSQTEAEIPLAEPQNIPQDQSDSVEVVEGTAVARVSNALADAPVVSQPVSTVPKITTAALSPYLNLEVQQAEIVKEGTRFFPNAKNVIKIHSGVGLWAYVDYNQVERTINGVAFEVVVNGLNYFGSPKAFGVSTSVSEVGSTINYSATEMHLIDEAGTVFSNEELAKAFVTISLYTDAQGEPAGANLFIQR